MILEVIAMKKFLLIAVCCGIVITGNFDVAEAAAQQRFMINQASAIEVNELGAWTHFRRKLFGGKNKDKRNEYHREHFYPPPPPPNRYHNPNYPPPRW